MTQCVNCQTIIQDNFCPSCGEKKFNPKSLSAKNLVHQLITSITDMDNKFFVSLRILFMSPGQLTSDYMSGLRKSRLSPFQLFLLVNIVYFLAIEVFQQNILTTPLQVHLNAANFLHAEIANDLVERRLIETGESKAEFTSAFDRRVTLQSKSLLILQIPMLALLCFPLFLKQRYTLVKSIVFASHFMSAFLAFLVVYGFIFWMLIKSVLLMTGSIEIIRPFISDLFLSLLMFLAILIYLFIALRKLTKWPRWQSFTASIFLTFGFYWVIIIYRMILFFTTFYSL